MSKSQKTKFFQNCLGVFQGGGCKGPAFVGAYKEAIARGVSFSELVGTSAGSIIAVLIGAGASPKQLEDAIFSLDFNEFSGPPQEIPNFNGKPSRWLWARFMSGGKIRTNLSNLATLSKYLGKHNSAPLKDWIEDLLREISGKENAVKFKDLTIPTSVIASDLLNQGVKIWGTHTTPDAEVAEAVRASCNFPLYFQPIDLKYVDGGLLSNLPSFIYANRDNSIYNRILAFSLKAPNKKTKINDLKDYLLTLANTTVDGNLNLQLKFQKDIHTIPIDTGHIDTLDFNKMNEKNINFLMKQGLDATKNFFDNEVVNIKNISNPYNMCSDIFSTFSIISQTIDIKVSEVIISDFNSKWIYELFPTFSVWVQNGASISFLLKKNNDGDSHGLYRCRLLKALGAQIIENESLPFRGFIINGENKDNGLAILLNQKSGYDSPIKEYDSKYYEASRDFEVISILREKVCTYFKGNPSKVKLLVKKVDENNLFDLLRGVAQYNSPSVKFRIESVKVENLIFITRYVRGFKYKQIEQIFSLYKDNGFELFTPASCVLKDNKESILTPPIVEVHAGKYYVIEGNTRLTYSYKNDIQEVNVVIVEGVKSTLPSTGRFHPSKMLITDKKKEGDTRYEEFSYSNFRKIEESVRNPENCLLNDE